MNRKILFASAAAALLSTSVAQAALIQLTSVSGQWTATNPSSPDVSGGGTNEIRWGTQPQKKESRVATGLMGLQVLLST